MRQVDGYRVRFLVVGSGGSINWHVQVNLDGSLVDQALRRTSNLKFLQMELLELLATPCSWNGMPTRALWQRPMPYWDGIGIVTHIICHGLQWICATLISPHVTLHPPVLTERASPGAIDRPLASQNDRCRRHHTEHLLILDPPPSSRTQLVTELDELRWTSLAWPLSRRGGRSPHLTC